MVSPERRREIIDALRRGTVPQRSLDTFAVGLESFEKALDEELETVAGGAGHFKAVRGEYGSGKTFCNCLPLWVDQGDGGVVGSTKD